MKLENYDDEQTWVEVKHRVKDDVLVVMLSEFQGCTTGGCGASGVGCQSNVFTGLFAPAPLLKLKSVPINIRIGDRLLLALPRRALFKMAFWGYGLPLLALLIGLFFGQRLAGDWGALMTGMSALLLTWLVIGKLGLVVEPRILEIKAVIA
jgi:positive regulator of sigma E activity